MNKFESEIATILEVKSVQLSDSVTSFSSWDSLAILSTLALADSEYGVTVDATQLAKAGTIGDIWNLIETVRRSQKAST